MSIDFEQALFTEFAKIAKAMGNPCRLEILQALAQGERSVESLAHTLQLSISNASQHLQRLRQAGLVAARADGHKVLYSLSGDEVITAMGSIRHVAERNLAEVNRLIETYLKVKDELEPVPADELLDRVYRGLATVVDVRPPEEFAAGHLPGAINIPLPQLERNAGSLPRRKTVVAYCRGPTCVLASDAVGQLREKGYKARRLKGGFLEWKGAGHPVEKKGQGS